MKQTNGLDVARVALGGAVAGLALFMINGVVNAGLLSGDFAAWRRGMGRLAEPAAQGASLALWTLISLIYGLAGVWLYAAIRPRYGAGPRTALRAGGAVWLASKLTTALDLVTLGIFPTRLIVGQALLGLVAIVSAVLVGAWVYRERTPSVSQ